MMNRRIRKKHHLGEFAVKCFAFKIEFKDELNLSDPKVNDFYIERVIEIIEYNHCIMVGWYSAVVEADDYLYKDMQLTNEIRLKIVKELSEIEGVSKVLASPLFDSNYETYYGYDLSKIELDPDLTEQKKKWFLKYSR